MPINALFVDLCRLTLLRACFELGMASPSAFSLFVRKLPPLAPYEIKISAKLLQDQQAARAGLSAATEDGG